MKIFSIVFLSVNIFIFLAFGQNAHAQRFASIDNYMFSNQKLATDALIIQKNGKIIYERYANGYHQNKVHRLWSMAKSFTGALIGIAIQEKMLKLDSKLHYFYPDSHPSNHDVTIKNLLQMSSGIGFSETYETNPATSDVLKMLFTIGFEDMADFVSKFSSKHSPGTNWSYSSGDTNILMGILKTKINNQKEYDGYPWNKLFNPLQISTATWEQDKSKTFVGSSYLFMTPRDLLKFGNLYLNNGFYNNKQIINKRWVEFSKKIAPSVQTTIKKGDENRESYGAQFWLNLDLPKKKQKRLYDNAPEDTFMALGHHGQKLIIIPSKKVIIARLASDKKEQMDLNHFFKLLSGIL